MNINKLTIKSQEALQRAQQLAMENGQQSIESGHLLKGILMVDETVTPFIVKKQSANLAGIEKAVDALVKGYPKVSGGDLYMSREISTLLTKAEALLKKFNDEFVAIEHMLLAMLETKSDVRNILKDAGLTSSGVEKAVRELRKGKNVTTQSAEDSYNALNKYAII